MATGLDNQLLQAAFQARPALIAGIKREAGTATRVALFNEIAAFVCEQTGSGAEGPAHKKRRVDDGATNGSAGRGAGAVDVAAEPVVLEIKDISVSIPQRKKFDLCFTKGHLYARMSGTTGPAMGIVYAWKDIEYAFCLPVPEKSQVQYNYVLIPRGACLPSRNPSTEEPLVFTIPATPPKQGTIAGPNASTASSVSDTYHDLFDWALSSHFSAVSNPVTIVKANAAKFHSVLRQPHRPKEKAVHVKAFRGSKDGYLFFLETGILWAFKKPLLFVPLTRIAAVSYTSVLQRTFNMVVEAFVGDDGGGDETEEIEFAMIDQEDYGGIDESYVRRKGLQDRSMAERRKAKLELAENIKKKGGDGEEEKEGDGMTELEKAGMEAEQALQDDEDEDEEDYDPGSEGESEGSGTSDDEDDEGEGDDDEVDEEVEGAEDEGEEEGGEEPRGQEVEEADEMDEDYGVVVGADPTANRYDDDMDEKFDVVG